MAALSPRSINLPVKQMEQRTIKVQTQAKPPPIKTQKDHPPPPPEIVKEPNGPNGEPGEQYLMGRSLGKGGFAICYEGETKSKDESLSGQRYALKIVKSVMPQPKLAEKFKTELQIHSKMHHPYIVEFHRAFTFNQCTYVVLELCNNGSLMDMVKQRKFLSEPEVRRYVIQMCGAIKYMHFKNVLHRDLKMGNIFLDDQMNVKIGDFGLAALLLSSSEYNSERRRTLCGTPNYIAPEVLAKGSKGHDHKVDIWSLGIIIFAMLTGFPPFQSKTQEEIYRKVKARSYGWPSTETCANQISREAKDLVALMLVEASLRPETDDIVAHPFFKRGVIPESLTPQARITLPQFEEWSAETGVDEEVWLNDQWMNFCRQCGVGRINPTETFSLVGQELHKSTYKQCLDEEKLGRTPIIPIPANMVYRALTISETEEKIQDLIQKKSEKFRKHTIPGSFPLARPLKVSSSEKSLSAGVAADVASATPSDQLLVKRPVAKSHAAQLREKDLPKTFTVVARPRPTVKLEVDGNGQRSLPAGELHSDQAPLKSLGSEPVRPTSRIRHPPIQSTSTRLTRSQTAQSQLLQETKNASASRQLTVVRLASTGDLKQSSTDMPSVRPRRNNHLGDNRKPGPILAPVEEEAPETEQNQSPISVVASKESQTKADSPIDALLLQLPNFTLVDPLEAANKIPQTNADEVQTRLVALLDGLRTALNRRQPNKRAAVPRSTTMPVVDAWVDYTNKFGVGFILDDGSLGCLVNAQGSLPSSGVLVRGIRKSEGGNKHKGNGSRSSLNGRAIEFYENNSEKGFKCVRLEEEQYKAFWGDDVDEKNYGSGLNGHDLRKGLAIYLWTRFANYMKNSTGKRQEGVATGDGNGQISVTFYQRLGNAQIWYFNDGSIQFTFPDRTRLVLSAGATHLDFYHLPEQAALDLARTSLISRAALDARATYSLPTRDLVCRNLPSGMKANQLEAKLRFAYDVIRHYVSLGGLGCVQHAKRIRWSGLAETPRRVDVWTSIGAVGGDRRYS
ncbi:MAG: Cell cycle serine/threonine-protein kinase cdc5/MSD2 [Peltula sp. TS41687]|nr:MAG: Cell cycle serine/threonine-protein kinase cdc5/MSD2 [Peltula sp. TS41687]